MTDNNPPSEESNDEQGKLIPSYLISLAEIVKKEQEEIVQEVKNINQHLQIAIDLVIKQRSMTGISVILEKTSIIEVVESALLICDLELQNIVVKKEFDNIPLIYTDKYKLLQILINLILNAKEALLLSKKNHKSFTISIKNNSNNMISVQAKDNGSGILPENLKHLFSPGFSTKREGHGYGLHNSILLAQELKGSIDAKSDGIDHGATFTLWLPLN